jgi:hypothetical protein
VHEFWHGTSVSWPMRCTGCPAASPTGSRRGLWSRSVVLPLPGAGSRPSMDELITALDARAEAVTLEELRAVLEALDMPGHRADALLQS